MFYKQSNSSRAVEEEVLSALIPKKDSVSAEGALHSLAQAAEDFEAVGMEEEAEAITEVIERIASGEFAMIKEAKKKARKKKKDPSGGHMMDRGMFRNRKDKGEVVPVVQRQIDRLSPAGKKALKKMAPKKACDCNAEEAMAAEDDELDLSPPRMPDFPLDRCPECGYDHALEPEQAYAGHHPSEIPMEEGYGMRPLNDSDFEDGRAYVVPQGLEDEYLSNSRDV